MTAMLALDGKETRVFFFSALHLKVKISFVDDSSVCSSYIQNCELPTPQS